MPNLSQIKKCFLHLTDPGTEITNIIETAKKYGVENRVFIFSSTSKITFPGGGVAFVASSKESKNAFCILELGK